MVLFALHNIVDDKENMAVLALNAAEYYEKNRHDTAYLEGLEAKRKNVEKLLTNLVMGIEAGVLSNTGLNRLKRSRSRSPLWARPSRPRLYAWRWGRTSNNPVLLRQVPAHRQACRDDAVLGGRQAENHVAGLGLIR